MLFLAPLAAACTGRSLYLGTPIGLVGERGKDAAYVRPELFMIQGPADAPTIQDAAPPADALWCGALTCPPGSYCVTPCATGDMMPPTPYCIAIASDSASTCAPGCGCLGSPRPAGGTCSVSGHNIVETCP